jgi:hypothetical protein
MAAWVIDSFYIIFNSLQQMTVQVVLSYLFVSSEVCKKKDVASLHTDPSPPLWIDSIICNMRAVIYVTLLALVLFHGNKVITVFFGVFFH